jgi:enoyl-[acyl-carrier protein] reductase II
MHPDTLREHIKKCKSATNNPFGVNVPLMYPQIEEIMGIIMEEKVPIVFTSAGNPKTWTTKLKETGIKVVHVVSSSKFAIKSVEAGVDAIVAEGFEAGGHNGREETTTLTLIPQVKKAVNIPLIAAGGISSGESMAAVFALGAEGVQVGTRFALTIESSASDEFKQKCITLNEGDTVVSLKKVTPVRLIKNEFYQQVKAMEDKGSTAEDLREFLGRGRSKKGIFEGDLEEGELEIGQIASDIKQITSAAQVVEDMITRYNITIETLSGLRI